MPEHDSLQVDGEVEVPTRLTFEILCGVDQSFQIPDISQLVPSRKGTAIRLNGVLSLVKPTERATYLGLHSSSDDFHASIPLQAVRDSAIIIYRQDDAPLSRDGGGPFRFYIPNHAECHTSEIDECANVKFIDRIELTAEKGHDNRPDDDASHAALHAK